MQDMTESDKLSLINAIALREGSAKRLCEWYDLSKEELHAFLEANKEEIVRVRDQYEEAVEEDDQPSPTDLSDLWISKKLERLHRYQVVANKLYIQATEGGIDATVLRELRFYMTAAANELGQLLHRGAGESGSDSLSVDIQGVSMDDLK
jgi:hypothetical protein